MSKRKKSSLNVTLSKERSVHKSLPFRLERSVVLLLATAGYTQGVFEFEVEALVKGAKTREAVLGPAPETNSVRLTINTVAGGVGYQGVLRLARGLSGEKELPKLRNAAEHLKATAWGEIKPPPQKTPSPVAHASKSPKGTLAQYIPGRAPEVVSIEVRIASLIREHREKRQAHLVAWKRQIDGLLAGLTHELERVKALCARDILKLKALTLELQNEEFLPEKTLQTARAALVQAVEAERTARISRIQTAIRELETLRKTL